MIQFELKSISPSSNWREVTVDRCPDTIVYTIRLDDGRTARKYDMLTVLLNLYGCAYCKMGSAEYPSGGGYTAHQTDDGLEIELGGGVTVSTTYEQLQISLESLLKEIFLELDRISDESERDQALEYEEKLHPFDVTGLYFQLTSKK